MDEINMFTKEVRRLAALVCDRCDSRVTVYILKPIVPWEVWQYTFKRISHNGNLDTHCEIALKWMPQEPTNEKSTSVQQTHGGETIPVYFRLPLIWHRNNSFQLFNNSLDIDSELIISHTIFKFRYDRVTIY